MIYREAGFSSGEMKYRSSFGSGGCKSESIKKASRSGCFSMGSSVLSLFEQTSQDLHAHVEQLTFSAALTAGLALKENIQQ